MKLPVIQGVIRRRLLINFRVEPAVMQRQLPDRFRPKRHRGSAVAGICLIRLEDIRPKHLPGFVGVSSENGAHRIAVEWEADGQLHEGVYIPRRDTSSRINQFAGGRLFPGEHHHSDFAVTDVGDRIDFSMRSPDGVSVEVRAHVADALPSTSMFASLAEASSFFEHGSIGYSATRDKDRLDGIRLRTKTWKVTALEVEHVSSSFFSDLEAFPEGSVVFD
ncbi:MAG: DUF2071 domain-containing protein, partial [Polyangiaceae bacterium]